MKVVSQAPFTGKLAVSFRGLVTIPKRAPAELPGRPTSGNVAQEIHPSSSPSSRAEAASPLAGYFPQVWSNQCSCTKLVHGSEEVINNDMILINDNIIYWIICMYVYCGYLFEYSLFYIPVMSSTTYIYIHIYIKSNLPHWSLKVTIHGHILGKWFQLTNPPVSWTNVFFLELFCLHEDPMVNLCGNSQWL